MKEDWVSLKEKTFNGKKCGMNSERRTSFKGKKSLKEKGNSLIGTGKATKSTQVECRVDVEP
jgi:hypothetical protein